MYSTDLALIHEAGFGGYARRAAPELTALLQLHGVRRNARVLEFGCGGGTVARHLAESFYDVMGIDLSPAMIRIARRRTPACSFRVASWTRMAIPSCAAVIAIGEVVTYMSGGRGPRAVRRHDAQLTAFFTRVFEALRPGGLLLFDFITSAERRTFHAKRVDGRNWSLIADATLDRSGRMITRRMRIARKIGGRTRRSTETHHVRVYTRQQMTDALHASGFRIAVRRHIGRVRLIHGDLFVIAEKPFL